MKKDSLLPSRPYMEHDPGNDTARSVGHLCFDMKRGLEFYVSGTDVYMARLRNPVVRGRRPGTWMCHVNYARKWLDDHFHYQEGT